jgi:hypothetical protein
MDSFDKTFGIFCELQNGYSLSDAANRSGDYSRVFSGVMDRLCRVADEASRRIQSSPWNADTKARMSGIREDYYRGQLNGRQAMGELRAAGVSDAASNRLVLAWDDHAPGFGDDFSPGLGTERIILRPNQQETRAVSRGAREQAAMQDRLAAEQQMDLFASVKKKRSRYNGTLVNNTFADATEASPVTMSVCRGGAEGFRNHPSVRYLVMCGLVAPDKRHLVKASLAGSLDTYLYLNYEAALGREPGPNIKNTGASGRVSLKFDTGSGHSTEVDLGGNLDTGYVVETINDGLGLFPEGTVEGDFIDLETIKQIVGAQGERDGGSVETFSDNDPSIY